MSHCPSCGRYVGPYEGCPYCGARTTGRISIRAVKGAAVLLSTAGLALLWLVATRARVPTVPIGQIEAGMNLAYVRVAGRCTRVPSFDPHTSYLSFWISDSTGELRVVSYRAETEALIAQGLAPALGDWISVAGTLRIRDDFPSLTVNAADEMEVVRIEAEPCAISAIAPERAYERVQIQGQIRQLAQPYPGLTLITLRDGTGAVDIALSQDVVALSSVTPTLQVGQVVQVAAVVSDYRGRVQLVPASASDIVFLDSDLPPLAEPQLVGELSSADVGRWIAVRGVIRAAEPFSRGVKLWLDDGTGDIAVLIWEDVHTSLADELHGGSRLEAGMEIEVLGALAEYRGELEVVPELATDVRVLGRSMGVSERSTSFQSTAAPSPTRTPLPNPGTSSTVTATSAAVSPPTLTPMPKATPTAVAVVPSMDTITSDHIGRQLTVEGTVIDAASFSRGFSFVLDDGHGRMTLLVWHEVYDDCWDRAAINLGATVRARGQLGEYEGQLQIEPRFGRDVKVIDPGVVQAPRRDISSLTADDQDRRVMIEGEVVRTEGLDSAVKVFLRDRPSADQREIPVFIWRNVLDRITDNAGLGTYGSLVRVVGQVQVYRSNLEIVPLLPSDVTVLQIP